MANAEPMIEALAEPMRREILERLLERPRSVTELADGLPVTRPAVSQHLKVLKDSRLVTDRAVGTRRIYAVDPGALAILRAYFDSFWSRSLETFRQAAELDENEQKGTA